MNECCCEYVNLSLSEQWRSNVNVWSVLVTLESSSNWSLPSEWLIVVISFIDQDVCVNLGLVDAIRLSCLQRDVVYVSIWLEGVHQDLLINILLLSFLKLLLLDLIRRQVELIHWGFTKWSLNQTTIAFESLACIARLKVRVDLIISRLLWSRILFHLFVIDKTHYEQWWFVDTYCAVDHLV